jgi:hypothetical protein
MSGPPLRCPFDGTEFSRFSLHQPLKPGFEYQTIVSRRAPRRFPHPKYCMYTHDSETLILAASRKQVVHLSFTLSVDSTKITKKSNHFMGILKQIDAGRFVSFSWHPPANDRVRFAILISRHDGVDCVVLPRPGDQLLVDPRRPDDVPGDQTVRLTVTDDSPTRATASYDGAPCFRMTALAEDEFSVAVRYPLSLYQSLCLALLRMQ